MDGILALWKERGMTSHDCVFKLRKILHTKKIGHGGTLDPDVDGVLPICIGKGTKVIEYLVDSGKVYEGEITVGKATATEDASGEVIAEMPVTELSEAAVDAAMASFIGTITQVPPMFSAVKVNGKRLYEYARQGLTVERPARQVTITRFERTSPLTFHDNQTVSWRFQVACGKGTYVRTLAVDTGAKLGLPAHMSDLTRTMSGGLVQEQAVTLAEVAEAMEAGTINRLLQPIETAVAEFPRIDLSAETYQKVRNGQVLLQSELAAPSAPIIALFYQGEVVALYGPHPSKAEYFKPVKVLRN